MAKILPFRRLLKSAARPRRWSGARSRPRVRGGSPQTLILALALVAVAGMASAVFDIELGALLPGTPGESVAVNGPFSLCAGTGKADCVVDGDTFRSGTTVIRIADIDTPEVFSPHCPAEKAAGERATRRLLALLNAGPFELAPYSRDEDRYGRKLRIVTRDGKSVGMVLVAEGLAREWDGAAVEWC